METLRSDCRILPCGSTIARLRRRLRRSAAAGGSPSGLCCRHPTRTRCLHDGRRDTCGGPRISAGLGRLQRRCDPRSGALGGADRLLADQQAAVARLFASAQALSDAPVWLVGSSPTIEAVMPRLGPGQVSGVVVTSVTSNAGSCTRTMYYSNPGSGAEPNGVVKTSGDACGRSPSFGAPQAPSGVTPMPRVQPNAPRLIEASVPADRAAQQPFVKRLAEEIKAPQPAS